MRHGQAGWGQVVTGGDRRRGKRRRSGAVSRQDVSKQRCRDQRSCYGLSSYGGCRSLTLLRVSWEGSFTRTRRRRGHTKASAALGREALPLATWQKALIDVALLARDPSSRTYGFWNVFLLCAGPRRRQYTCFTAAGWVSASRVSAAFCF